MWRWCPTCPTVFEAGEQVEQRITFLGGGRNDVGHPRHALRAGFNRALALADMTIDFALQVGDARRLAPSQADRLASRTRSGEQDRCAGSHGEGAQANHGKIMDEGEASTREYQTNAMLYSASRATCPGAPDSMPVVLPLRAAITRGALITLANWPTVLIDFIAESIYKLALAVPVIGGAFMVALLTGADIQTLLADGVMVAADRMLVPLGQAPVALLAFWGAIGVVGVRRRDPDVHRQVGHARRARRGRADGRRDPAGADPAVGAADGHGVQRRRRAAGSAHGSSGAPRCWRRGWAACTCSSARHTSWSVTLRIPVGGRVAMGVRLAVARGGRDERLRRQPDGGQSDL